MTIDLHALWDTGDSDLGLSTKDDLLVLIYLLRLETQMEHF